ncbi:MAG: DUF3488 and transglutaminase-like domain-containing protein [Longimicrobiales bacterium]
MTLTAVIAFISGAGLDAPSVLPAILILAAVALWEPSAALRRRLAPVWKIAAVLLALRAGYHVIRSPEDIVLPMVDLLLLLLVAEVFRQRDTGNDARVYALTFALLVASAAYRPGALFALAFVAYMAAATVSLMLGHMLHSIERRPIRDVPVRGRFLLQSAAFSGIALVMSALVFLLFPRVTRGWVSRGLPLAGGVMGFSDRVSLLNHGGRLYPNPELVLRVEFPSGPPANLGSLHWRGMSFDRFNGSEWLRTPGLFQPLGSGAYNRGRETIVQHIYGADLPGVNALFGLNAIVQISPDEYHMGIETRGNGDYSYVGRGPPVYTVHSNVALPPQAALDSDTGAVLPQLRSYLQIPQLEGRITQLADSLAQGRVTTADKVRAVEAYLRPFTYTLELPGSAREATLEHFLFVRRKGHCEYFSTAMAVLLRAMGAPTRNVNGFLGGEWNGFGGFMNVTQNQAHSWVEVWYPQFGWIQYDPTPASLSGVAENRIGWLRPLRAFVDGLDYRWNRWVLEYDVRTQLSMFNRVADALRVTPDASTTGTGGGSMRWMILAAVLALTAGMMRRSFVLRRNTPAARESAAYLKLRRMYEKRGYPPAIALPPLAFVKQLQADATPGAESAAQAVALYVRARFHGKPLSPLEAKTLKRAVANARAKLKAATERR